MCESQGQRSGFWWGRILPGSEGVRVCLPFPRGFLTFGEVAGLYQGFSDIHRHTDHMGT